MLIDTKKYERLLSDAQKRRADLDKGIDKLRQDYEHHGAHIASLQQEKAKLERTLADFERGNVHMSQQEMSAAADRVRYLTREILHNNAPWSASEAAWKAAINERNGVMTGLRQEALNAFWKENDESARVYERDWLRL